LSTALHSAAGQPSARGSGQPPSKRPRTSAVSSPSTTGNHPVIKGDPDELTADGLFLHSNNGTPLCKNFNFTAKCPRNPCPNGYAHYCAFCRGAHPLADLSGGTGGCPTAPAAVKPKGRGKGKDSKGGKGSDGKGRGAKGGLKVERF